jgi:serine/threonine-protein kinase
VLIAWSRLLSGQWRDPLVGRELLIGCLFGVLWFVIRLRLESRLILVQSVRLIGANGAIANLLSAHQISLLMGIAFLGILLLCRVIFRNTWLAAVAFTALATVIFASEQDTWFYWVVLTVTNASAAVVYIRFGLLSAVTGLMVFFALIFLPHTADFTAWFAAPSKFTLVAVLLLAGYGFYTSTLARYAWLNISESKVT